MNEVARRDFLRLTVASLAVPAALASAATARAAAADARGRWADAIFVNALGGLEDPNPKPSDERVMREAHASGLTAVNFVRYARDVWGG